MPPKTPRQRKTSQRGSIKELKPRKSISEAEKKSTAAAAAHVEDKSMVHLQTGTAFKVLLSARFCAAIWSNISDCDETFNYWEPMHFMMYGKGMQTWEYSPEYALRSYSYILVHVLPALIYENIFSPNRLLVFYFVRCLLGFFCAILETYFYKSVCREFGVNVGRLTLVFLLFSPGMFIASAAFLPSSFSMYMVLLSMAAWYQKQFALAVLATALSALLSWPFAALIGVPIAVDMVIRRREILDFCKYSLISLAVVLVPMVKIDSDSYGRAVIAPLNIVLYNVFSSSRGPDLYGTEPWYFYFVNGILNFNLVFPLAILSAAVLFVAWLISDKGNVSRKTPMYLYLSPLYLWLLVFCSQQHKEERFLFPIYPLICLCGALSIDGIQQTTHYVLKKVSMVGSANYLNHTKVVAIAIAGICTVLGLSRNFALYKGYHAPLDTYMELAKFGAQNIIDGNRQINVCVGKEWHRFPSSFFLPDNRWNLRFLESEFKGQLPQPYQPGQNATSVIPPHMNDMNREERTRYFPLEKCDFLVDLDNSRPTKMEPVYSDNSDKWEVIHSMPFLDSERSPRLLRAFYVPFLTEDSCVYGSYQLLRAKDQSILKKATKQPS